ncbi:MAG: 1-(5-phosphoribosyl)-5-[(5-phosphoribosylamino)methylideneamino]imidazole-4-carboxamide isomerase [Spartobacteria bacterium]|nr:1-(5-phosphoribosyl)-5-[(5-phosphoribosylamino)methylideneamino]imidazole-4-carboxamide isomerase [Spartobacteria bacterium]
MVIPAIDLKGGRCVRLRQGRAEEETVYAVDPVAMGLRWQDEGARFLHVVDLDGAFEGHPVHDEVVIRIAGALDIPVEIGGGVRTEEQIDRYLNEGVNRVILGTRACADPDGLGRMITRFGAGLAVGIDARDGLVQVKGWTETTGTGAVDLARQLDRAGIQTIIYTDTARDGMLQGVNAEAMRAMCAAVSCQVVASGGVSAVADMQALRALDKHNLVGAIVGKALYEGTVSLKELMA